MNGRSVWSLILKELSEIIIALGIPDIKLIFTAADQVQTVKD